MEQFAMIHNGIIENNKVLEQILSESDVHQQSETDSEILLYVLVHHKDRPFSEKDIKEAIMDSLQNMENTYAIVIQNREQSDRLYCIRKDSPFIVGTNDSKDLIMISSEFSVFPDKITEYTRLKRNRLYIFVILTFNDSNGTR